MNIEVNYLSVLVSGATAMAIGFLWYSPALFGSIWMKLKGINAKGMKAAQKEMGKLYFISFIASLLTATVLYHVMVFAMNFYQYSALSTGLTSATWMWIGFVMPVQLTGTIFGDKKWGVFAIDTGYQLAALVAMGIVLALM